MDTPGFYDEEGKQQGSQSDLQLGLRQRELEIVALSQQLGLMETCQLLLVNQGLRQIAKECLAKKVTLRPQEFGTNGVSVASLSTTLRLASLHTPNLLSAHIVAPTTWHPSVSEAIYVAFERWKNLQDVSLINAGFSIERLLQILEAGCRQLNSLHIGSSNAGLSRHETPAMPLSIYKFLQQAAPLQHLHLDHLPQLCDTHLTALPTYQPTLVTLKLANCPAVTAAGISRLMALMPPNLKSLDVVLSTPDGTAHPEDTAPEVLLQALQTLPPFLSALRLTLPLITSSLARLQHFDCRHLSVVSVAGALWLPGAICAVAAIAGQLQELGVEVAAAHVGLLVRSVFVRAPKLGRLAVKVHFGSDAAGEVQQGEAHASQFASQRVSGCQMSNTGECIQHTSKGPRASATLPCRCVTRGITLVEMLRWAASSCASLTHLEVTCGGDLQCDVGCTRRAAEQNVQDAVNQQQKEPIRLQVAAQSRRCAHYKLPAEQVCFQAKGSDDAAGVTESTSRCHSQFCGASTLQRTWANIPTSSRSTSHHGTKVPATLVFPGRRPLHRVALDLGYSCVPASALAPLVAAGAPTELHFARGDARLLPALGTYATGGCAPVKELSLTRCAATDSVAQNIAATFPMVQRLRIAHVTDLSEDGLHQAIGQWVERLKVAWIVQVGGMGDRVLGQLLSRARMLEEMVLGRPLCNRDDRGGLSTPMLKLLSQYSRQKQHIHVEIVEDVSIKQLWGS